MTIVTTRPRRGIGETFALAGQALRLWTAGHVLVAILAAAVVGLVIGIATVLIPNPVFARDIPPVWWNYPVLVLTAVLSGMLIATYFRPGRVAGANLTEAEGDLGGDGEAGARRSSRMGMAGGVLAWFAVGCPVCNKIALIALGYSGAITWFAPVQPYLALAALALTGVALLWRLRGQVACPVRPSAMAVA